MIDDGESTSGSDPSELACAPEWMARPIAAPSVEKSIARPGNWPSRRQLLLVVLLTQAVEVEEQVEEKVEEQLTDGTLETDPQALVDRLRTVPKTVIEFRSSARKWITVGLQQKRLETIDDWQNAIVISQDGFTAKSNRDVRF